MAASTSLLSSSVNSGTIVYQLISWAYVFVYIQIKDENISINGNKKFFSVLFFIL
jgi:hypothetical protein